jgi:hypothetical protein
MITELPAGTAWLIVRDLDVPVAAAADDARRAT